MFSEGQLVCRAITGLEGDVRFYVVKWFLLSLESALDIFIRHCLRPWRKISEQNTSISLREEIDKRQMRVCVRNCGDNKKPHVKPLEKRDRAPGGTGHSSQGQGHLSKGLKGLKVLAAGI